MAGREARGFAFVAAEVSGDQLAAPVIERLKTEFPQAWFGGIAGERMLAAGCEAWWHVQELSVRGYVEVLAALPRLVRLRRNLYSRLLEQRPDVVVGVDAPDFNLRLEARLRQAGVRTVHYISPSIWAWRRERIELVRRAADRVLLIFPFEEAIYRAAGIDATYVGHPLAAAIPRTVDQAAARQRLGMPATGKVAALLPGSRRAEIEHLAPPFLAAAQRLLQGEAGLSFVLPAANAPLHQRLADLLAGVPVLAARTHLCLGQAGDALAACDAALVASGTATLEAALYGRPMVIAYRMPRASWWLMRNRGYLPWVGLPNILLNESLVPELLQDDATPENLAAALAGQLDDEAGARRLRERFAAMHESLLRDTPALAAEAIAGLAQKAPVR